jgi:hypothetical protein
MPVDFVVVLPAGKPHFGGVDDHYVIACVQKRGENRLMLAHEEHGGFAGEFAENYIFGIQHMPLANNPVLGGELGTH